MTDARSIPILPQLRPYLNEAFNPEDIRCISRYRVTNANLRRMFLQILAKAEITPWPKLFHNLRASLQTDLEKRFRIHVVCS